MGRAAWPGGFSMPVIGAQLETVFCWQQDARRSSGIAPLEFNFSGRHV